MSNSVLIQDFEEKSKEVKQYCLWLINIGDHFDIELEYTLKATVFLLLYNLVESTIRSAIQYIYDDLKNHQISFDQLNQDFQNHIIKILKDTSLKNKDWQQNIAITLVNISSEKDVSFAGNLDAKKIREILKNYGIELTPPVDAQDLRIVKDARKDLSHGHSTFSEKGRYYSPGDLLKMQERVTSFLKQVLTEVENYVDQQNYLKRSL
jgi:hypothetical protein